MHVYTTVHVPSTCLFLVAKLSFFSRTNDFYRFVYICVRHMNSIFLCVLGK